MLHYGIEYFSKCHKHFIWSFYEKIIQVCLNYLENDDEFKEDLIKDLKKKQLNTFSNFRKTILQ